MPGRQAARREEARARTSAWRDGNACGPREEESESGPEATPGSASPSRAFLPGPADAPRTLPPGPRRAPRRSGLEAVLQPDGDRPEPGPALAQPGAVREGHVHLRRQFGAQPAIGPEDDPGAAVHPEVVLRREARGPGRLEAHTAGPHAAALSS